ncbi:hypothetical protein M011DRAFT_124091 [Sporormia fimetaria CBS 119925]|uniref:Uncharacterized protein n=1 Tax=Sporormia fimetaria CBS 119925 TaxID=1340428 RepID=A0A6A6V9A0_9PLEO|nr:hypothetical protein M011DRAFT_124091 [Sporormia fimetaria CBS 119925]
MRKWARAWHWEVPDGAASKVDDVLFGCFICAVSLGAAEFYSCLVWLFSRILYPPLVGSFDMTFLFEAFVRLTCGVRIPPNLIL